MTVLTLDMPCFHQIQAKCHPFVRSMWIIRCEVSVDQVCVVTLQMLRGGIVEGPERSSQPLLGASPLI